MQEQVQTTALLAKRRPFTNTHRIKFSEYWFARAREEFWVFRIMMRPNMLDSWWQQDLAWRLDDFWTDFRRGKRPKLVLGAPPQHGKSETMKDFACWVAGKDPALKIIFASYADELGISANLHMQRTMATENYRRIFPNTRLAGDGPDLDRSRRTTTFLEFIGKGGSFRNTTVDGKINGFGLDIGIIDDPIKGRAEAQSKPIRDKTWNWLADDFFNRFSDRAGMVMIQTRWHVDDPTGRWLERFPETQVLSYPAIAERISSYRDAGEALFPEHKSLEFLMERRRALTEASWQSLYQQHPIIVGGGILPVDKFSVLDLLERDKIAKSVRFWDKAGTEDGGAYTAGVLMHRMRDKTYVIEHVVRGQWSALEREEKIAFWARQDRANSRGHAYEVGVEQEPGSGGKESAEATIRNLAGFNAFADKVTGSKEARADPFAAQVQGGNVKLIAGQWHYAFLDECESFPQGKYRDQVDACSGAFNRLILSSLHSSAGPWSR